MFVPFLWKIKNLEISSDYIIIKYALVSIGKNNIGKVHQRIKFSDKAQNGNKSSFGKKLP